MDKPNKNNNDELGKIYTINGLDYKIGKHNMVFMRLNNTWIKSTKTMAELKGGRVSRFRDYGK